MYVTHSLGCNRPPPPAGKGFPREVVVENVTFAVRLSTTVTLVSVSSPVLQTVPLKLMGEPKTEAFKGGQLVTHCLVTEMLGVTIVTATGPLPPSGCPLSCRN